MDYCTGILTEENRQLKRKIEMYESTDAILEMKNLCDRRVRASSEREKRMHDGWMNCVAANGELKKRNKELREEKEKYRKELKASFKERKTLERKLTAEKEQARKAEEARKKEEELRKKAEAELEEEKSAVAALKEELCRLKAILDHDGTTNGIPTSQTPKNKKKVIPNSRTESTRKKGGQPGHEKHSMPEVRDEDVTETEEHTLECCPECGGELEELKEEIDKDEVDYEVRIIRRRHKFRKYRCKKCGRTVHAAIPERLKEKTQYGPGIQALVLELLDLGFVSVDRTRKFMNGLFDGKQLLSEGYIGKVQKKTARLLKDFREQVRQCILMQKILHWDDTVVFMDKQRACFRFYGNGKLALYFAHRAKNAEGLEKDGVLGNLTEGTHVMHDHLTYNYRKEFLFQNIECCAHLERELQRVYNDSGHEWALKLKELISGMIHRRKEYLAEGKENFTDEETDLFEKRAEELLEEGRKICEETDGRYFHTDEKNALLKLEKYRENYFAWVYDFSLPTTNNEAESSLRMIKSKMKIAGQFGNEETADEFALIRTYTETCRRNGVNELEALKRLIMGNPYQLSEIMA